MSLTPPLKVGKLQTALHTKAKKSPDYRFYALYDKIYRRDVLDFACDRCRANGGVPGVDGLRFRGDRGIRRREWLDELAEELRSETYRPSRSDACTSPRMASRAKPGRWGFRASKIAWCRWLLCWSWSRSSRPTWSPNNTPIAPSAAPWTPFAKWNGCCEAGHTEVVDADLIRLFRQHPSRRVDEIGVPARSATAASCG